MVLLHAGIADRTMWAEHLPALAGAGLRAVALDLPGFGEAPIEPGEQAPWADVLRAMDALSIERATLVGNSLGGAVALRVAVLAPERVTSLVLVSAPAPGLEPSPQLRAAWEAEESALREGDVERAVASVVDAWTLPDAPDDLRERIAAMQRRAFLLQQAAGEAGEGEDPLGDRLDALAELRMPALCAAGARDKQDFLGAAELLAQTLPNARHATIARAGHLAPLEQPAAFRRLLIDFLDGVSGG